MIDWSLVVTLVKTISAFVVGAAVVGWGLARLFYAHKRIDQLEEQASNLEEQASQNEQNVEDLAEVQELLARKGAGKPTVAPTGSREPWREPTFTTTRSDSTSSEISDTVPTTSRATTIRTTGRGRRTCLSACPGCSSEESRPSGCSFWVCSENGASCLGS